MKMDIEMASQFDVPNDVRRNPTIAWRKIETSNSSLKTRGAAAPPALKLLGVFVRFRRTFAEVIMFGGASAHEF